jgi:hypothetical protein
MKHLSRNDLRKYILLLLVRLVLLTALFGWVGLTGEAWAVDQGWPRQKQQDGNTLVYYQPQLDSWKDQKLLKARLAVMLTLEGQKQPIAGAVWLTADTDADLESRTVSLDRIEVEKAHFSVLDEALGKKAEEAVKKMLPSGQIPVSLDRILAGLKRTEEAASKNIPLRNDPPRIFVSYEPARLLIFDGEPVFAPVPDTNLQYAVNTNWTLFTQQATSSYFLLDGGTWLFTDKLGEQWKPAKYLPGDLAHLPKDDNFKDARENVPPKKQASAKIPKFFTVKEPAELIVIDGEPKLQATGGSGLKYVANTDDDLFYYDDDKSWYFLVAGRWYRSPKTLNGPWTFVTPDLPKVFASIPPKSAKGRVLYSVPGTVQAQEAVLAAGIPQTATIKPGGAKLSVSYAGEPEFEPISGTSPPLQYAVNASVSVIKVSGTSFYACDRGVWFTASSSNGPWIVASSVPQAIYTIPPSSPVYPVSYVYQTSPSPDVVYAGYTPGYVGLYIGFGVAMWGTGYYYPPYYHAGPVPVYYSRPYTWGAHAWYNPATSTYYRGGTWYGPYGGYGAGASYNPATGTYRRGYGAYGPAGGYRVGQAYNPRTGTWATSAAAYGPNGSIRAARGYNPSTGARFAGAQGSSVYGSWGSGVVTRGGEAFRGGYASTAQGTARAVRGTGGGGAVKGPNNTYVGNDGNVYRKSGTEWQKYENGAWSSAKGEAAARAQTRAQGTTGAGAGGSAAARQVTGDLNRESANRAAGEQRASQWNREYTARSSAQAGAPRAPAAMPRGGGMRGGGGRR